MQIKCKQQSVQFVCS